MIVRVVEVEEDAWLEESLLFESKEMKVALRCSEERERVTEKM